METMGRPQGGQARATTAAEGESGPPPATVLRQQGLQRTDLRS